MDCNVKKRDSEFEEGGHLNTWGEDKEQVHLICKPSTPDLD